MVNMTDFKNDVKTDSPSKVIFTRQKELMAKYEGIEERNGLLETHDVPVDIDSYKGQARLKNFAWRVTEELTEALEPVYTNNFTLAPNSEDYIHTIEEYIDAVHFMAELTILSGLDDQPIFDIPPKERVEINNPFYLVINTMLVIMNLGLAMNCLKNKPWKQTHVTTDVEKYSQYIVNAGKVLTLILRDYFGLQGDKLANCYLNKADVNKFRQESGY